MERRMKKLPKFKGDFKNHFCCSLTRIKRTTDLDKLYLAKFAYGSLVLCSS